MTSNRPSKRPPALLPIQPRRYPAAYPRPVSIRTSERAIKLTVGPLPIRVLRAVLAFVRHLFKIPELPAPKCVPTPGPQLSRRGRTGAAPRCLHCKVAMTETHREAPEPYGVWAVFCCPAGNCPVCQGLCRNQARAFLPPHWQSGLPGQITRL
jgi:hypothetical protein